MYLSLPPLNYEIWQNPVNAATPFNTRTATFFWPVADRIDGVPLYYVKGVYEEQPSEHELSL